MIYMSSPVNAPTTILPGIVASSTGGLTSQYETAYTDSASKTGGKGRRTKRRKMTKKRKNGKRGKTNKRVTFMTKWMGLGK